MTVADRRRWRRRRRRGPPRPRSIPALPAAFLLALLPGAGVAEARTQGPPTTLTGAGLHVEVAEREAGGGQRVAHVRLDYRMSLAPGTDTLPLLALAFAGAVPAELTATIEGEDVPVRVAVAGSGRIRATVAVPPGTGPAVLLRLDYRVAQATADGASYRMAVPLLVPDAVPSGAEDGFFTAALRLPADHTILESFPALPPRVAGPATPTVELSLQVVPAVVRWRAQVGPAPLVRFSRLVDLAAVVVLLVGGAGAVRMLVRQQGEGS